MISTILSEVFKMGLDSLHSSYERMKFFSHKNNIHKHPKVTKLLCKYGRHDYEVHLVHHDEVGTKVTLSCFYCSRQKTCLV